MIPATISPTTSVTAMLTRLAAPLRRLGTRKSWARLTCPATAHTAPGTYLPSCPRKFTRTAGPGGSGDPRSASRARQASIWKPSAAITASAAPTTSYQASSVRAEWTCGHCDTSPHTANPSATSSSAARTHGLALIRRTLIRRSTRPAYPPGQHGTDSGRNRAANGFNATGGQRSQAAGWAVL